MNNIINNPYKTILVITLGFFVIYLIYESKFALWVGMGAGLGSLLSEFFANKLTRVWTKLTYFLGLFIPNLLLSLIFYFILTPLAFFTRIGNVRLKSFKENNSDTSFTGVNKTFTAREFEKTW